MYPENKLLSCILGFIIFVIIVVIIWMNYVINNNKKAVTFFNLDEIKEISYSNSSNDKFKIEKDKLYLILDNETITDGIKFDFDSKTGEFKYKGSSSDLYLRSVGNSNITIWYKYKIYVLEKDIIAN